MNTAATWWWAVITVCLHAYLVECDEQEYRLTRYLMANYDPAVRPSQNATQPLRVTFDLSLHHVIQLDEKNQILNTVCWITERWTDVHLRWNASDFGNIGVIRIPAQQVWKPDIILHNNAEPQGTSTVHTNAIVRSSGEVTFLYHGMFRSTCEVDLEFFPFDVQRCHMKFASLTYDGQQVELSKDRDQADISNFQQNGEFILENFSAVLNIRKLPCCDELYPDITYTVRLRRRPIFYVFNLILPCILINGISIIAFYVPSESGEKVTLGITTLLCITVFLVVVRETLPPSQKTPLINLYYGVTVCLVASATFFSVITLNLHYRGDKPASTDVPRIMRRLVLGYLSRLLFVNCGNKKTGKKKMEEVKTISRSQDFPLKDDKLEMDHIEQYHFSPRLRHRKEIGSTSDLSTDEFERQFLRVLNKVYETIEKNEMRVAETDRKDTVKSEWHQVSLVCDRFLLALFLLSTAVATFLILFSSPHGP